LFGPDSTLWTLFVFLHFVVAGIFIIFGMIAYSNYTLKAPLMMDVIIMFIMVIVWFLLYVIARQIREKGHDQMNELEQVFLKIIR
jgi:ABC-type thiamin/hydroxymethylpyrimidine transport system permease subunit